MIKAQAKTWGAWAADLVPAAKLQSGKPSGGIATLTRAGMTAETAEHLVIEGAEHRVSFTHVSGVTDIGLLVAGIYLRDTEGTSAENMRILERLAVRLMANFLRRYATCVCACATLLLTTCGLHGFPCWICYPFSFKLVASWAIACGGSFVSCMAMMSASRPAVISVRVRNEWTLADLMQMTSSLL